MPKKVSYELNDPAEPPKHTIGAMPPAVLLLTGVLREVPVDLIFAI